MLPSKTYPIIIFADGASSGNPGPGGWGAVIALPDGQIEELGGRDPRTTNNRMEMMAVLCALERIAARPGPVTVYTDSTYVIRGITQWVWGWRKRGWKTSEGADVVNQDLWQALMGATGGRAKHGPEKIDWKHVRGHAGVPGNERVDRIAVAYSKGTPIQLYRGPLLSYPVAIHDLPEDQGLPEMRPKQEKKAIAHAYLSLLGSTAMRHRDWPSCERRVKGQPGARFKKAMTPEEERSILQSWGVRLEDVREG
jgi:ribonuclease HI